RYLSDGGSETVIPITTELWKKSGRSYLPPLWGTYHNDQLIRQVSRTTYASVGTQCSDRSIVKACLGTRGRFSLFTKRAGSRKGLRRDSPRSYHEDRLQR